MACLNGRVKTIEQRRGEPSRAIPSVTLSPCLFLSASTSHAEGRRRAFAASTPDVAGPRPELSAWGWGVALAWTWASYERCPRLRFLLCGHEPVDVAPKPTSHRAGPFVMLTGHRGGGHITLCRTRQRPRDGRCPSGRDLGFGEKGSQPLSKSRRHYACPRGLRRKRKTRLAQNRTRFPCRCCCLDSQTFAAVSSTEQIIPLEALF